MIWSMKFLSLIVQSNWVYSDGNEVLVTLFQTQMTQTHQCHALYLFQ